MPMPDLSGKLRDDELLTVILSGVGEGRYRHLDLKLAQVLYEEEFPKPKEKDGKKVEVKPHRLLQGRYFIDFIGTPQKSFSLAWMMVLEYRGVEPVGFNGDYLVHSTIVRDAERIKQRCEIPEEDSSYLRDLGQRVRSVDA